jgi:hypothetical protein
LLGNHDLELSLPAPRRALLERLGSGRIEFIYDNQAFVDGPVLIEHGNRYDSWNVVSHDGLREVRSALSRGESPPFFESPAGSLLVIKIMNRIKALYPFVDLLKPENAALLPLLAVLHPPAMKDLPEIVRLWNKQRHVEFDTSSMVPVDLANIAGQDADNDQEMIDLAWKLAEGQDAASIGTLDDVQSLIELWRLASSDKDKDRQRERLYGALRARAESTWQSFDVNREAEPFNTAARALARRGFEVVVFGHTHLVKRVNLDDGAVYLNTGTWADLMQVPEAVLTGDETEGKRQLHRFLDDLMTNRLEKWRRQVPTFARIDLDGTTVEQADVYVYEGGERIERVPDGRLTRLMT